MVKPFLFFFTCLCALSLVIHLLSSGHQSTGPESSAQAVSINDTIRSTTEGSTAENDPSGQDLKTKITPAVKRADGKGAMPAQGTEFTPEQRGVHMVFPPDESHPQWRGAAPAPSVGKLTVHIDMSWEWMPGENITDEGTLSVFLTPKSDVDHLHLRMRNLQPQTVIRKPHDSQQTAVSAHATWLSEHKITPNAAQVFVQITYGDGFQSRSISIPLGWDGIGDDRPMSDKPVPGVIREHGEVLMPAKTTINP